MSSTSTQTNVRILSDTLYIHTVLYCIDQCEFFKPTKMEGFREMFERKEREGERDYVFTIHVHPKKVF